MTRRRLDVELVRRGLLPSREVARAAIASGQVTVGGAPALKPARLVDAGEPIELHSHPRFVGRGGEKLDAALDRFAIDVRGLSCLDVGASTGGFTDCLLSRGASGVCALDVGHGQLHPRIRGDERVRVVERVNVRDLSGAEMVALGGPWPLVVVDVSFISLTSIVGVLCDCVRPPGNVVALVKPQFEAGRAHVSAGRGVVRDRSVWAEVLAMVADAWAAAGATVVDVMASPLRGGSGNVEFVQRVNVGHAVAATVDTEATIVRAIEEVSSE